MYFLYLEGVFASEKMDDLEGVLGDSDGHEFLAVVPSVHHQRVGQTFDDWTLRLAESFCGVSTSRMWQVFCVLFFNGDVILE